MTQTIALTATIVLYKEKLSELNKAVNSFLEIPITKKLFLVDNTPNQQFKNVFNHTDITYVPNQTNLGFGAAHNLILTEIENYSKYHLVLNPDVFFEENVIVQLIKVLENDATLAMVAPKVLFPNGNHQYSCRRYPVISELILRRLPVIQTFFKEIVNKGEYKDKNLQTAFYAEYLTGCFQLYNTTDFVALNGFDERYFLYMEDVDICKKIDLLGKKKRYCPEVSIVHVLKRGSSKKLNLFIRHTISMFRYYLKWGFK